MRSTEGHYSYIRKLNNEYQASFEKNPAKYKQLGKKKIYYERVKPKEMVLSNTQKEDQIKVGTDYILDKGKALQDKEKESVPGKEKVFIDIAVECNLNKPCSAKLESLAEELTNVKEIAHNFAVNLLLKHKLRKCSII